MTVLLSFGTQGQTATVKPNSKALDVIVDIAGEDAWDVTALLIVRRPH